MPFRPFGSVGGATMRNLGPPFFAKPWSAVQYEGRSVHASSFLYMPIWMDINTWLDRIKETQIDILRVSPVSSKPMELSLVGSRQRMLSYMFIIYIYIIHGESIVLKMCSLPLILPRTRPFPPLSTGGGQVAVVVQRQSRWRRAGTVAARPRRVVGISGKWR